MFHYARLLCQGPLTTHNSKPAPTERIIFSYQTTQPTHIRGSLLSGAACLVDHGTAAGGETRTDLEATTAKLKGSLREVAASTSMLILTQQANSSVN